MNSKTQNIRTKVDKRQIIQYLLLRQRILHNKVLFPTNDSKESIYGCKLREKEIQKLITCIKRDTIDKEIRKMHQYIHRQNDYLRSKKEKLPEEAIVGLISSMEDVKNGDYEVITNNDANLGDSE